MLFSLKLIFLATLLAIVYQDFKARSIYWWLPVLVFMLSAAMSMLSMDLELLLINASANLCFVLLLLAVLALYIFIKYKTLRFFTSRQFGLGDILMLFALCPLMEPVNFILFMCLSNIGMLACELLKKLRNPSRKTTIPYAGYICAFLSTWTLLTFYIPNINFLSDIPVYFLFSTTP